MDEYSENELSKIVLDIAFQIHKTLGPGLFESVYEEIFIGELLKRNLKIERQKNIYVQWAGKKLRRPVFRADIIINGKLLLELKSVENLSDVHLKQVITYLKLTELKLGLLINFNVALLKNGIRRVANNL